MLVYIDDATGRLLELRFVPAESTFDYFYSTQRYLERYGKPVAFYSDKHGVFRVNAQGATSGTGMTQYGRALNELNIDIICADTPQAKGRVERANKTLQDRLVKELRLHGINDMEAANNYVDEFCEDFNARFGKAPKCDIDVHRPLNGSEDLDRIFSWQEQRKVTRQLTIQYDKVIYLLDPKEVSQDLVGERITVHDYPDGTLELCHKRCSLPYSAFDKVSQVKQADVVDNKRLGAALSFIKEQQAKNPVARSAKAPKRRGQKKIAERTFRALNVTIESTP